MFFFLIYAMLKNKKGIKGIGERNEHLYFFGESRIHIRSSLQRVRISDGMSSIKRI